MTAPTPARRDGAARLSVAGGPAEPGRTREQVRAWAERLGFGPAAAAGSGTAPARRGRLAPVPADAEGTGAGTGRGAVPEVRSDAQGAGAVPAAAVRSADVQGAGTGRGIVPEFRSDARSTGTGTGLGTVPAAAVRSDVQGADAGPGTVPAAVVRSADAEGPGAGRGIVPAVRADAEGAGAGPGIVPAVRAVAQGADAGRGIVPAGRSDVQRGGVGRGDMPSAAGRVVGASGGRNFPAGRVRAWAELLRVPAVFTVPGDAFAGAAAAGVRPGRRTGLAVAASLCLYEAGMALNDWADRDEDAVARPHRPIPSGRIRPGAALAAAGALTAAGLALAARAGRPALAVAAPLAATVWAYDLKLKHTPAGPAAMAAARSLDLLLGAAASAGTVRPALRPALLLGGHTYAVTQVSRREAEGGSTAAPLAALAATTVLAALLGRGPGHRRTPVGTTTADTTSVPSVAFAPAPAATAPAQTTPAPARAASGPQQGAPGAPGAAARWFGAAVRPGAAAAAGRGAGPLRPGTAGAAGGVGPFRPGVGDLVRVGLAAAYWRGFAKPLGHAVLNPSPVLAQRAVGGGIRAMIPLQGSLMAGAGAPLAGVATFALAPVAARLARKVSTT